MTQRLSRVQNWSQAPNPELWLLAMQLEMALKDPMEHCLCLGLQGLQLHWLYCLQHQLHQLRLLCRSRLRVRQVPRATHHSRPHRRLAAGRPTSRHPRRAKHSMCHQSRPNCPRLQSQNLIEGKDSLQKIRLAKLEMQSRPSFLPYDLHWTQAMVTFHCLEFQWVVLDLEMLKALRSPTRPVAVNFSASSIPSPYFPTVPTDWWSGWTEQPHHPYKTNRFWQGVHLVLTTWKLGPKIWRRNQIKTWKENPQKVSWILSVWKPRLVENDFRCSFKIWPQLVAGLELFIDHLRSVSLGCTSKHIDLHQDPKQIQ